MTLSWESVFGFAKATSINVWSGNTLYAAFPLSREIPSLHERSVSNRNIVRGSACSSNVSLRSRLRELDEEDLDRVSAWGSGQMPSSRVERFRFLRLPGTLRAHEIWR
jgi:hypothetical protein